MQKRHRCVHCKRIFIPNPRIRNQQYCGDPACQRARKAKWQRQKMATDEDYRLNQSDAHQRWRELHPGYYREYRQSHPDYCQRNRELQKYRDGKRRARHLAKMDPLNQLKPINPGTYYLNVFRVLVADRKGLSYYSYDKICTLLKLDLDSYILARNGLMDKDMIAFNGHLFQVLSLPDRTPRDPEPLADQKGMQARDPAAIRQLIINSIGKNHD